ncbi:MAG: glycosyltransferase [Candidatus Competibacteraceae bacterium]|nr:glycosyltransferase [Candidatus Competibacteraceae bacterium]MCP5124390.1 glycosyltransferase [Gammaproteobacteria bacterium]
MSERPHLLFVSPRFLFPTDQGGKIRTTQILRGMKGGRFEIILVSPASIGAEQRFAAELQQVCDRFVSWPSVDDGRFFRSLRLRHLVSRLPVSIAADYSTAGAAVIHAELAQSPTVAVFDFLHSMVMAPDTLPCASVLFTHNVEAEIFNRHAQVAANRLKKALWRSQFRKMNAFEQAVIPRFDTVVAVSERDAGAFARIDGARNIEVIGTGVDLEFFTYTPPGDQERVVFTGAMDWLANIDGIEFFMQEVWPQVAEQRPRASMTIVGRNPSPALIERAKSRGLPWQFTGFVDDIRPHIQGAAAYVVPLRVGGGTRIKVYEAMATGIPVVSTGLGVEGLPLLADQHYLHGDTPKALADAIIQLLENPDLRQRLAFQARHYIEENFSSNAIARQFEDICWRTTFPTDDSAK